MTGSRCADLYGLINDVHAMGAHTLAEEPARSPFARLVLSDHARSTGKPSGKSGTNRALQINTNVIARRPEVTAEMANLL